MRTFAVVVFLIFLAFLGYFYVLGGLPAVQAPATVATATPAAATTSEITHADWIAATAEDGTHFSYPPEAGGTYVSMQEWPPVVSARIGAFSCNEKRPSSPGAQTSERTIAGDAYCITVSREGAAGSTYATYSYATLREGHTVDIAFTVRLPQCMNYDEPARGDCTAAQAAFEPDALAARVARTVAW